MEDKILDILDICYKILFKMIRKSKKLTQKELSEIIGKKTITIQAYENGRLKVSSDLLYLLVKKTHFLKNQFIDIITSPTFFKKVGEELNIPLDEIVDNNIFSENMIDLIYELFYEDAYLDFQNIPICPENKNEYLDKLTEFCHDQIYSHIIKIKRLYGIKELSDDNVAVDISNQVINYLNFLLQEKGIINKKNEK